MVSKKPMIHVERLSKVYKTKIRKGIFRGEVRVVEALREVTFDVEQGEIFGLLGPNGAGKTTLIKILTTLLEPTSGTAMVNGFDVIKNSTLVKSSIGAMLMGERGLYWKLTGRENLEYFGALYHVPKKIRRDRIDYLIDLLDLEKIADRTVETYSSGQKMKMVFGRALINDAPILMLDEPTNTLDVREARRLRKIVRDVSESSGKTVIYCSHLMTEVEELCNRVAIIDRGKIIALDYIDELKEDYEKNDIYKIEGDIPESVCEKLEKITGVLQANFLFKKVNGNSNGNGDKTTSNGRPYLNVVCENDMNLLPDIITVLTKKGAIIQNIDRKETTLEDVFISLTGRSLSEDTREIPSKSSKRGD